MTAAGEFKRVPDLETLLTRAQNARRWPPRWRVPNTPAPRPARRSVFDWVDDYEEAILIGLLASSFALLAIVALAAIVGLLAEVFA